MIPFGGWEMPVQYTSIVQEHRAVRQAAGLFDISHMGEVQVRGPGAERFLNGCLTNDVRKLAEGQGQYTLMCNERGGVVDDLYAYRLGTQEYLLIINASRIDADVSWLQRQLAPLAGSGAELKDVSDATGAVAVQGPRVAAFIDQCFPGPSTAGTGVGRVTELGKNQVGRWSESGTDIWISRTGYTGEDGFEIVAPAELIEKVWQTLMSAGASHGLVPAGLGARDTLRTEVCYPLYGHELNEHTTPIEAGLGFFVAVDKGEFLGRAVLAKQKSEGVTRRLAAFKMAERSAPPRPDYPIWSTGSAVTRLGSVASGTQSPTLGVGIGMAYVPVAYAKPDTSLSVEIRGKPTPAVIVPKPFYRKQPEK